MKFLLNTIFLGSALITTFLAEVRTDNPQSKQVLVNPTTGITGKHIAVKENDGSGEIVPSIMPTIMPENSNTSSITSIPTIVTPIPPKITNATTVKPTDKPTPPTDKPTPPTDKPTPPTDKPTSTVNPTSQPTSSKPPATTSTTATPHHSRRFDGPSFIGGIILASGLMAIGFVAFKFYKARTERNYHTL